MWLAYAYMNLTHPRRIHHGGRRQLNLVRWLLPCVVVLACIALFGSFMPRFVSFPLDQDRDWRNGFYGVEKGDNGQLFRWTAGKATLELPVYAAGMERVTLLLRGSS